VEIQVGKRAGRHEKLEIPEAEGHGWLRRRAGRTATSTENIGAADADNTGTGPSRPADN
jgi:hypothetical protein